MPRQRVLGLPAPYPVLCVFGQVAGICRQGCLPSSLGGMGSSAIRCKGACDLMCSQPSQFLAPKQNHPEDPCEKL